MRRSKKQSSKSPHTHPNTHPDTPPSGSPLSRPHPTRPNAFSAEFLDRLRNHHDHPPTPEASSAGPFRVEMIPPQHRRERPHFRWACLCAGESVPRACVEHPDFAYLTAAALALADQPPRFALVEDLDAEEDLYLLASGCGDQHVDHGTILGWNEDLPELLTALDELRVRPLALAQFLLSVGDEALGRVGVILSELAPVAGEVPR